MKRYIKQLTLIGTTLVVWAAIVAAQAVPSTFAVGGKVFNYERNGGVKDVRMYFEVVSGTSCALPRPVLTKADGTWSQSGFTRGCRYNVRHFRNGWTFRLALQSFSTPGNTLFFYQSFPK